MRYIYTYLMLRNCLDVRINEVYVHLPMYVSTIQISELNHWKLQMNLHVFLNGKSKIYCGHLRRYISLAKLPNALTKRKDAKRRLQRFWVAIDILRHARFCNEQFIDGYICYEFRGNDRNGTLVIVHVREEVVRKDKILFLVSCF